MASTIVSFTPNAKMHIKKTIQQQQARGFRLAVKKTGCSGYAYLPDIVNEKKLNDVELQEQDFLVFIDQESIKFLQGTSIDFIDNGLGQTKMVFHNPNAANLCGCGESFNLAEEFDE